MKVQVKDLHPNPYRKIYKYPIDQDKVEALKISINDTEFWDNLLARKSDGKIEIAYGHHRIQALKELGIKEIDIPIKNIHDSTMIKIMANENMDHWSADVNVVIETIITAKEYLDDELQKYNTYEQLMAESGHELLFDSKQSFANAKSDKAGSGCGVGHPTILKFLGGNWKKWQVQQALAIINKLDYVSVDALSLIENLNYAENVALILKKHEVKKKDQKKIVKSALEKVDTIPSKDVNGKLVRKDDKIKIAVELAIEDHDYEIQKDNFERVFKKKEEEDEDGEPYISEFLDDCIDRQMMTNTVLDDIFRNKDQCKPEKFNKFFVLVSRTLDLIKKHGGKECHKLLLKK